MSLLINELFSVRGKTALITGGSRGIGEMMAAGLLTNGAKVYISSRKQEVCDATAERLASTYGSNCISIPADLSTLDGIEQLSNSLSQKEAQLDILVNNAGAAWGARFEDFPEKGFDKIMDTNVKGPFFLVQKLAPLLRKAGKPEDPARIVNIGSIDGLRTPNMDNYPYGPSKAALHHLSRVFAALLVGDHVTVNAIAPGPFPTWMLSTGVGFGGEVEGVDWAAIGKSNPSGRVGSPEDIVGMLLFLVSRAGAYVVGQTIALDGGIVVTGSGL